MKIIRKTGNLKNLIRAVRKKGLTVGFVPTMGALHQGHLSLMRQARRETDLVVISIFVNPLQFGPQEDFKEYPRDLKGDAHLVRSAGVDVIFVPEIKEMYHPDFATYVDMSKLTDVLCGRSRPGHFRGVMTVVMKLFNIVEPDIAYFGAKDYQQALIIKRMVKDLNMNVVVKTLPTVREDDGLAMSSRNKYLSPEERLYAPRIYKALQKGKELILSGETDSKKIRKEIISVIKTIPRSKVDYIEIVHPETLERVLKIKEKYLLIAVAVFVGETRLVDNIIVVRK